jgi:hypothetical protein
MRIGYKCVIATVVIFLSIVSLVSIITINANATKNKVIGQNSNGFLTYTCKGALGDLIHLLYVIDSNYKNTGMKGKLLITPGEFTRDITQTYNDIQNFITQQEYILEFKIQSPSDTDIDIDLNKWRNTTIFFKTDWISLLTNRYNLPIPQQVTPWLHIGNLKSNYPYEGTIVVHRSLRRNSSKFPWEFILKQNRCLFVSCDDNEYNKFKWKELVPFRKAETFDELVYAIYKSKFYIGNQSSPLAIAYGFMKPCLAELSKTEEIYYKGLTKYNSNYYWISLNESYLNGINKWLNFSSQAKK